MIRFIVVLLAFLTLSTVPVLAAGEVGIASGHDATHHQTTPGQPSQCDGGNCAVDAICAWICSGIAPGATGLHPNPALFLTSRGHALPQHNRGKGIAPLLDDRPPILS